MAPRTIRANGVDLCIETFGDPGDQAVLLIAGASSSMDWWEEGFCERLAAGSRLVIRYDLRDTGQSVVYPAGSPAYSAHDLEEDVIGILDALGIERAHLVGMSMGGGIAQVIALEHAARVASLTLISTSAGGDDLPGMSAELRAAFANPRPAPDWSDHDAVVDHIVEDWRPYAGSRGLDQERLRSIARRVVERTRDIEAAMTNHWLLDSGEPLRPRIAGIEAPTLVIHGTDDPFFPLAHGQALAREIPDARLLPLHGGGHEYPPPESWDEVVPAILDHTSRR